MYVCVRVRVRVCACVRVRVCLYMGVEGERKFVHHCFLSKLSTLRSSVYHYYYNQMVIFSVFSRLSVAERLLQILYDVRRLVSICLCITVSGSGNGGIYTVLVLAPPLPPFR